MSEQKEELTVEETNKENKWRSTHEKTYRI